MRRAAFLGAWRLSGSWPFPFVSRRRLASDWWELAVVAGWIFAAMLAEDHWLGSAWLEALVNATVPFEILVSLDKPERFSVPALILKVLTATALFGWAESGLRRTRRERS